MINDFEKSVFALHPQIEAIKQKLIDFGAVYAAMSGSGSSVFGLFQGEQRLQNEFPDWFVGCVKMWRKFFIIRCGATKTFDNQNFLQIR